MSLLDAIVLFAAGFVSGAVNAVAGGGTFLTFGALSLVGMPPIVANATSSVAQFPGYVTSTLAYWNDIRHFWRGALLLGLISVAGALAGALILLSLDNPSFRSMVPWLLIAATALFAAGPWLKPTPKPGGEAAVGSLGGSLAQFRGLFDALESAGVADMLGMTFDVGNWEWSGEAPLACARALAPYVEYIHCKSVAGEGARRFAVAPAGSDAGFAAVLAALPGDVPRGIEFPFDAVDLAADAHQHVTWLKAA